MIDRWTSLLALLLLTGFGGCAVPGAEDLSSLAAKPALPFSVLITGGGFVDAPTEAATGPLARTYELQPGTVEAFDLEQLESSLRRGNVFAVLARDDSVPAHRKALARLRDDDAGALPLQATLDRARRDGHDFLLVAESILDGPVESRGVNDRWPFTIGAWLFALGAFIPDRTYESRAGLRISMRDVYTGRRVFDQILVAPGPVDLNMFERCSFWGFVQSILIPPFWTSTDAPIIVASVRSSSTERILVSAVRRLKSFEVERALSDSGPASIKIDRIGGQWTVTVLAKEAVGSVALRLDGRRLDDEEVAEFERKLLESRVAVGETERYAYRYHANCNLRSAGQHLQVIVGTEAARISSVTRMLEAR